MSETLRTILLLAAACAIMKFSFDAQLFGVFLFPIPDSWKVKTISTMCFVSCVLRPGYPPNATEEDIKAACLYVCDLSRVKGRP